MLQNNYSYNCQNLTSAGDGADATIVWFDTEGKVLSSSPFANPDNADFKVTNDDLIKYEVGDPRWRK